MINRDQYPFPRPSAPVQLYLLGGLSVFGLAAMWLAALHAFLQVAGGAQAFFAATLIEAGLIIEALALIKRPKVWYTWVAVAISLIVSGTYNYIQADLAAPDFNPWQLGTLALGPLSALCFVSLTLGYELREYQDRVDQWQTDRGNWIEQRRQEQEAYQRQLDEQRLADIRRIQDNERERQERETERRLQLELDERAWQRKQQQLAVRRAERSVQQKGQAERSPGLSTPAANVPERSPEFDELLRIVHERSNGKPYSPENVQEWAGLGRTKTFELLKYGRQLGDVHQVGKGQYTHNGKS